MSLRLALLDGAQSTIDLQSYLLHDDRSGHQILEHLYRAAKRGVRVRILLDDIDTNAREPLFAALAAHSNFSLKLFHPFAGRRFPRLSRALSLLFDLGHRGRRMHNKLLIVDQRIMIIGGRNIGDDYLAGALTSEARARQFVDLDVLIIGPVIADAATCFATFWHSHSAVAISALTGIKHWPLARQQDALQRRLWQWQRQLKQQVKHQLKQALRQKHFAPQPSPVNASSPNSHAPSAALEQLAKRPDEIFWPRLFEQLIWAPSQLLWDSPEKIRGWKIPRPIATRQQPSEQATDTEPANETVPSIVLFQQMLGCSSDLLLVSPYFVPGLRGYRLLKRLRNRRVRVRLLTNSLSATDVPIVHGAYERYRGMLLRTGVEIFELKAQQIQVGQLVPANTSESSLDIKTNGTERHDSVKKWHASLHAKTYIFDQCRVFVGSFNLDPRSLSLNTETGILIDSPAFAQQIEQLFMEASGPERSYRLHCAGHRLSWHSLEQMPNQDTLQSRVYAQEPRANWPRRLLALAARLLPIEAQL